MTRKEIGLVSVSGVVLLGALYFMYILLFPASSSQKQDLADSNKPTKTVVTGNIDEETLTKVKAYKDYGGATLDSIGRVNPFGPLN